MMVCSRAARLRNAGQIQIPGETAQVHNGAGVPQSL